MKPSSPHEPFAIISDIEEVLTRLPKQDQLAVIGLLMSRFIKRVSEPKDWDRIAAMVSTTLKHVLADAKREPLQ